MIWQNLRMALSSLAQAKLRSFLTILGIVIGVGSVVTVFALGAGVKRDVANQVAGFGANLVQVNPGKTFTTDEEGHTTGFNPAASFGVSTLTEQDVTTVKNTPNVAAAAPFMLLSGVPVAGNERADTAFILATEPQMIDVITEKIAKGRFLADSDTDQPVAVLGDNVARALFNTSDAVDKTFSLRGQTFKVIGVTEDTPSGGINVGPQLADALYIPFSTGKKLNGGVANIVEIDARISSAELIKPTVEELKSRLKTNHGGEDDFTVLTAEDQLKLFDTILNIITSFVGAIAGISLFVGGIGIMNIMLVSVTERTREIGVRKAIGATNRNIMSQFLIEALVLSSLGGLLGMAAAFGIGNAVRLLSDITPVFSPGAFVLAIGISSIVGVIFGLAPAVKAARKRPIEALRYE